MKSSADYKLDNALSVLLVGEPKTGKTSAMMAFPEPGILDWDLNLSSGVRRATGKTFKYTQPSTLDDGTERPLADRWGYAVAETKEFLKDPAIRTIVVDGLGLMCSALCDHIVRDSQRSGSNKTGRMELQNYGELARLLRAYVMMCRASGKYFVVTSHQVADKDDATGALRYALAIPGSSKDSLGGCFTDVWATTATRHGLDKVKYEIRTKPTGLHVTLGCSFAMDAAIDVTDRSPAQIWALLEPKITGTSPVSGRTAA